LKQRHKMSQLIRLGGANSCSVHSIHGGKETEI